MKAHQLTLNGATPHRTRTLPTIGGNGIASSDANELNLQFVVKYREAAKHKEAASQFDLDDIRSRLATFSKSFNNHLVETITSAHIDDWLRSLNVSIVTRNHYRRLIMLAFNFAVQRGYTNSNPVFGRFVVSRAGNDPAIAQLSDGLLQTAGHI